MNNTNVAGSIVLCHPNDVTSWNPRSDIVKSINNVIAANGVGIIYAQYTNNLLLVVEGCNKAGVICVVVDFEVTNQIVKYHDITARYDF